MSLKEEIWSFKIRTWKTVKVFKMNRMLQSTEIYKKCYQVNKKQFIGKNVSVHNKICGMFIE